MSKKFGAVNCRSKTCQLQYHVWLCMAEEFYYFMCNLRQLQPNMQFTHLPVIVVEGLAYFKFSIRPIVLLRWSRTLSLPWPLPFPLFEPALLMSIIILLIQGHIIRISVALIFSPVLVLVLVPLESSPSPPLSSLFVILLFRRRNYSDLPILTIQLFISIYNSAPSTEPLVAPTVHVHTHRNRKQNKTNEKRWSKP